MRDHILTRNGRRDLILWILLLAAAVAIAAFFAWLLFRTIPRRIVLASGVPDGMYHQYAQQYKAILARDGVAVEERLTGGTGENVRLLRNAASGVDVAFMQGGAAAPGERTDLVMLASLYYEPLWIFFHGPEVLTQIDELRNKRIAAGPPESGVRVFAEPLLAANNVNSSNTRMVPLLNLDAIHALQSGEVDAAMLIGPVKSPAVWQALHDPGIKLMSLVRADAYPRRFPHITKLTLPPGTIDLALHVPDQEVQLIATKAMLVARDDLPPAISHLLLDAARELHAGQGYFERPREFPNTDPVDLPSSRDAERHYRFGPSLLHRYLPFFVAVYVERLIILLVPLIIVLIPVFNLLPRLLRWHQRSRIYRWYGELALLERQINACVGTPPIEQWLAALDRIERAAARIRVLKSYASEAYTLRLHIELVRNSVRAKAQRDSEQA